MPHIIGVDVGLWSSVRATIVSHPRLAGCVSESCCWSLFYSEGREATTTRGQPLFSRRTAWCEKGLPLRVDSPFQLHPDELLSATLPFGPLGLNLSNSVALALSSVRRQQLPIVADQVFLRKH